MDLGGGSKVVGSTLLFGWPDRRKKRGNERERRIRR